MGRHKRVLTMFICLAFMLLTVLPAGAAMTFDQKIIYEPDIDKITITGTVTGVATNLDVIYVVYRPGYSPTDVIDAATAKDAISVSGICHRDSNGKFSDYYVLGSFDTTGQYTVIFSVGDEKAEAKFTATAPALVTQTVDAINAAFDKTPAEKMDLYDSVADQVALTNEMFDMLSPADKLAVIDKTFNKNDFEGIKDVSKVLVENSLIQLANSGTENDIKLIVESYPDMVKVDFKNKWYLALKADTLPTIYKMMTEATMSDIPAIAKEFQKCVAVQAVNQSASMGKAYDVISDATNKAYLGISTTAYDARSDKDTTLKAFYSGKPYANVKVLGDAWDAASALPKGKNDYTGPTGPSGPSSPSTPKKEAEQAQTPADNSAIAITPQPETPSTETRSLFSDLDSAAWAAESINELAKTGIIEGTESGVFSPNANVTREQFLKMILLAANIPLDKEAKSTFSDVDENEWYYIYAANAQALNLVMGNPDGSFGIGQNITRQDLSVMLVRLVSGIGKDFTFKKDKAQFGDDVSISDYAQISVYTMQRAGIIGGYPDGTFGPTLYATRAEAAKIVYEICQLIIR